MSRVARYLLFGALVLAGAVVGLYRDPRRLLDSVRRLRRPPVDAAAVTELADGLPDEYGAVEDFVSGYVPYKSAWEVYGLPWYFPTVPEVLSDRAGDCQARALLTASILAAKGMPYTMRYSFDHVWVDHPGKKVVGLEDPSTSFMADEGKGWTTVLPTRVPLRDIVRERVAYHWTPMPLRQKLTLVAGLALAVGLGRRLLRH